LACFDSTADQLLIFVFRMGRFGEARSVERLQRCHLLSVFSLKIKAMGFVRIFVDVRAMFG
jgi:hypothetical protein